MSDTNKQPLTAEQKEAKVAALKAAKEAFQGKVSALSSEKLQAYKAAAKEAKQKKVELKNFTIARKQYKEDGVKLKADLAAAKSALEAAQAAVKAVVG